MSNLVAKHAKNGFIIPIDKINFSNEKSETKLPHGKYNSKRLVFKGAPSSVKFFKGYKPQTSARLKEAYTARVDGFINDKKGYIPQFVPMSSVFPITNNEISNPDAVARNAHSEEEEEVSVTRVSKDSDEFLAINKKGSPIFTYASTVQISLIDHINLKLKEWKNQGYNFPQITEKNYINVDLPNPNIRAENNICFFIMIRMPFEEMRVLVSNLVGFQSNDDFQENINNLLNGFSKLSMIPRHLLQCCAINLNTYNYHDDVKTHQRAQQHHTYTVYYYSTTLGFASEIDPIIQLDDLNNKVNIIYGFSENSKTEDRIIGGELIELFSRILGFDNFNDQVIEETAGGTRKEKRKTKRKIQRSKRRKHRSQKKSNRSLKHRQ